MKGLNVSINLYVFIVIIAKYSVASSKQNITVVYMTERSSTRDFHVLINRTIGLVKMAAEKSKEIVKHTANLNFIIRHVDFHGCTALQWGALAAEMYYNKKIDAILGPGCSFSVAEIARLAADWNIPHITYGGNGEFLANKTEFATLTRLSSNLNSFGKFYFEVFRAFNWTDVVNIYDTAHYGSTNTGRDLQNLLESYANIKSHVRTFRGDAPNLRKELIRMLTEAKKVARGNTPDLTQKSPCSRWNKFIYIPVLVVVLLLCSHFHNDVPPEPQKNVSVAAVLGAITCLGHMFVVNCIGTLLRQLVLLAPYAGLKPGEYTIIFLIIVRGSVGDYGWERGDEFDLEAKMAYQSLFVVENRRPIHAEFLEFEQRVFDMALSLYNYTWANGSELSIYNIAQYDVFMLYAYALNDTLAAGEDPRDGNKMRHRLWNRIFEGIGGMVYVDENGDRDTDIDLLDMEPTTGKFRVVAQYLGYTKRFGLLSDVPIHWPNNAGPTPNRPKCGFVGELCISHELPLYATVVIAFAAVMVILVIVGSVVFRRMQLNAAIQSRWWRVKYEDITFPTSSTMISSISMAESQSHVASATISTRIGIYKGAKVHVRKLKIKSITIDRKLLLELKTMREVSSPNLITLIGLCPDVNKICILTEFCSRGSLQAILQNESIQLDKDFRLSLINDIVQGMYCLHRSPIEVHGSLTSSNCIIDSRFVLKITGFGLRCIDDRLANVYITHDDFPIPNSDIFWTAPEILRTNSPWKPTQPGDVYSFAIILYEMCTRNEPYTNDRRFKSVEDTIEQIRACRANPRRPSFGSNNSYPEISKLAIECWKEMPEERPTFRDIRKKYLRRDNPQGDTVLDVLLNRMEQYANNLEGLVQEKTNAFLDEKKRSEELLYEVLPKSVADQLKVGQMVTPEAFDSVTIYFSDIVGFTTISAASTPFQIVDFLNDVYTCFDETIGHFDVYKVETIGDAYMVVSGLPVRNGNEHARQIARMSLKILDQVQQFIIQHQPETQLRARIGINSGPVVAGVVGRKMPRYCLFGDTVNTASRMESNGLPLRIHISESTRVLLEIFGNFLIEERGNIEIKGKGMMFTHWLVEEQHMEFQKTL